MSKQALEAAKLLHRFSKSIIFEGKSGKRIYIGNKWSHISNEYTREFLMFPESKSVVTVEPRLRESQFSRRSVIGPNTKEILETLGWRFDGNEYDKITINERENSMLLMQMEISSCSRINFLKFIRSFHILILKFYYLQR